jgi:UDP:flavonoid glycosyltransferase YjiC (YdhE family)
MDVPELYDADFLSDSETCIGPVNWEPDIPLPEWWGSLDRDKPIVFVSPGSSGDAKAIRGMLETLRDTGLEVMVATARRIDRSAIPEGVRAADYIPGLAAADVSDVVICNGGSGMVYQSLTTGTPVLGIPSNIDQFYVMEAVERKGAGMLIRAGRVTGERVRVSMERILGDESFNASARSMRDHIAALDCRVEFHKKLEEILRLETSELPESNANTLGLPLNIGVERSLV